MALNIICVSSVTHGEEVFSRLGRVELVEDIAVDAERVRHADLLVTRSKTRVDAELLRGSALRFAGTATAGVDHVDEAWLRDAGIHFTAAPGCNANSVSEYLCAALHDYAAESGRRLAGSTLGIVGHGHVGKKVEAKARAMGMTVLLNDPPLFDESGDPRYLELDEVCRQADFLTLHVPLVETGPHPTRGLIGSAHFHPGMVLVNACRGEVVAPAELHQGLDSKTLDAAILDVWDPEPAFPAELLSRVRIGTAHIAGYSFEGKFNGTLQVYDAACAFLGLPSERPELERRFRAHQGQEITAGELDALDDEAAMGYCIGKAYDLRRDDRALREGAAGDDAERAAHFRQLRNAYRRRDEFPALRLHLPAGREALAGQARALGFEVEA